MTAELALRPLEPSDADGFAALVKRAFQAVDVQPPASGGRLTGDDVRAHLALGGGVIAPAGCAGLLWAEKEGGLYVSRVAVDPAWQRRGLATAMLAAAEAEAVRRGLPRLWLSTRLALTGNRRLFARCGFQEATRHAHPGYDMPTFVDMTKPVGRCAAGLTSGPALTLASRVACE